MSIIKRLGNVGKGLWKVNMGPRDPDDEKRVKALQAELARLEAEAGLGGASTGASTTGGLRAGTGASTLVAEATDEELLQAKLLLLADELREGRIDRATYDQRCEALISAATGDDAPKKDDGPVKRTL